MTSTLDPGRLSPITERLDAIHQQTGSSRYQIFTDWLDLMVASLSLDDDTYLNRVDRYQDSCSADIVDEIMQLYTEAFGQLVLAVKESDDDVLGGIYEQYSLTSDRFAQYFTPDSLARAMATINIPSADVIREATPGNPITVGDPACGSGRLLLASAKRLHKLSPETPAVFVGQDIDPVCVKMTAITFTLNSIPGYAIQGDSLTMDLVGGWRIDPTAPFRNKAPVVRCSPAELPVPGVPDVQANDDHSADTGKFCDLPPTSPSEAVTAGSRSSQSTSNES